MMSAEKKKLIAELLAADEQTDVSKVVAQVLQQQSDLFIRLQQQSAENMERTLQRALSFATNAIDAVIARASVDPVRAHTMLREARAEEAPQTAAHPVHGAPMPPEPLDADELKTRIIADTQGRSYGFNGPSSLPGRKD